MKILITGYKGLIGHELYNHYKKLEQDVTGFDRGDVILHTSKFDLIIHCAANCLIREVIKDTGLMMENIDLTYKIMEHAREHKTRVVLFSSSRVHHEDENTYTVSKKFLENISKAYRIYDVESIVIRPETVWGLRDKKRVISLWINSALKNEDIYFYGDPSTKELPPIYVNDFIKKCTNVIYQFNKYKHAPVVISGKSVLAIKILREIIKQTKSKSKIHFLPEEVAQPQQVKSIGELEEFCTVLRMPNIFEKRLREVLK